MASFGGRKSRAGTAKSGKRKTYARVGHELQALIARYEG